MKVEEACLAIKSIGVVPPKSQDGDVLAEALIVISCDLRENRTGVSMKGVDGAPDWLGFESDLWKLSEKIRPLVVARKDWRSGSAVINAVYEICADSRNGKGRQNLVLMLGDFGGSKEGDLLGKLIADSDVRGHAIKALTKLKDLRFRSAVQSLVPELKGWVRSAARKYLGE